MVENFMQNPYPVKKSYDITNVKVFALRVITSIGKFQLGLILF